MDNKDQYCTKQLGIVMQNEGNSGNKLDNALLITLTGSIVLSVNFILGGNSEAGFTSLLLASSSWIILVLGLLAHIFAYLLDMKSNMRRRENIQKYWTGASSVNKNFHPDQNNPFKKMGRSTK